MSEKTIYLEGIDPVVLYGVHNAAIDRIKAAFPRLKVIPRGNEIKVVGEEQEPLPFPRPLLLIEGPRTSQQIFQSPPSPASARGTASGAQGPAPPPPHSYITGIVFKPWLSHHRLKICILPYADPIDLLPSIGACNGIVGGYSHR